jgi:hypothetical protein
MISGSESHGTHDHILMSGDTGSLRAITYSAIGSLDRGVVGSDMNVSEVNISLDCSLKRR